MLPALRKRNSLPTLIDEFFGRDFFPGFFSDMEYGKNTPAVNILEGKDDYRIEVAAPGLDKKDFKIDLDNNVLTIRSEKEEKQEESEDKWMRREFRYSTFARSFSLPDSVDGEKISASHKDGVLTLILPKKEHAKIKPSKQISIS